MTRAAFVLTLAVAGACVHGPTKGPTNKRALAAREQAEIDSSPSLIVTHLRTRNDDGLTALMTHDAILDLPAGEVLWSPGAILQGLGLVRGVKRIEDVTLAPRVRLLCD